MNEAHFALGGSSQEIADLNDRLAREHPINDYYERSFFLVRHIERRRLQIIRRMVGPADGLQILDLALVADTSCACFPRPG